ncbi:trigger factor [gamma proteobacterium HTCC5015]|nr:trigger factor [gamma proteobacterium HTCC5015]
MQVSLETSEGLERKLTVEVPAETVAQALENQYQQIARSAKIPGFRPGKVPMSVVKKRYAGEARQDVVSNLIQSTLSEALTKEEVNPAGYPAIEKADLDDDDKLTYVAVFEVYPEIQLADPSKMKVEKLNSEIGESDIDEMVETLRQQRAEWNDVERASKEGDQVTIDFVGRVDGEEFEGGKGNDMPLVLGSGSMIDGFESQIEGMKGGDEKTIKVTFPEDYNKEDLQGKDAEFDITVQKVAEQALPEVDEEFAKAFGVEDGSTEKLRENLQNHMQRELTQTLKTQTKKQVMDALLEQNELQCPSALVDQEIQRLKEQAFQQFGGQAPIKLEEFPNEPFQEEAERRVKLGLLVGEVVKQQEIKASPDKVKETLEQLAASYEDPQQVVDYYYENPQMLASVEAVVVEDQAVDWLMSQAKVKEETKPFSEVMKINQQQT